VDAVTNQRPVVGVPSPRRLGTVSHQVRPSPHRHVRAQWNTASLPVRHLHIIIDASIIHSKLDYCNSLNFSNNIYFAKGQVHQKGKKPSKLATIAY